MANAADRVFMNAKVYSVALDGTETRAEAVAVKDGRFVFIGSDADAKAWIGENTQVTDCRGGSLLPGFGDAHMHFSMSSNRFGVVSFNDIVPDPKKDTPDDVIRIMQERLKSFAEAHPDDPVIHGIGWDRGWFSGSLGGIIRPFTRHDVDAAISDRPVILNSFCGHVCMLNTKALEAAGVTKDTPDPEAGLIRREADGTPDGYLQEPVIIGPVCQRIPNSDFTAKQHRAAMLAATKVFAGKGYTLLSDCMWSESAYDELLGMVKNHEVPMRVSGVYNVNDGSREKDLAFAVENRGRYDVEDLLKVETVKYFVDGNYSMVAPYTDSFCDANGLPRGSRDPLLWDREHLMRSMEEAQKADYNIHIHAMGNYAVQSSVDCLVSAQEKYDGDRHLRNIIAHCSFVEDEDKKRMGDYGIIASLQPSWACETPTSAPVSTAMLGREQHEKIYPIKSMLDAGVILAFGSDFAVDMPDPFRNIEIAQTRKVSKQMPEYKFYKDVRPPKPEERISLKEAIKAQTINVAYQFNWEKLTGSIELGKSAELCILDRDIETLQPEDLTDLKVVETVFKGQTSFKA